MGASRLCAAFVFATAISLGLAFAGSDAAAQSTPPGQRGAPPPAGGAQPGATGYKNLQVLTELKDGPAGELIGVMQFMSGSLSVTCNYCHVSQAGPYDSDANKKKATAREMIRMTRAINQNSFGGRQIVTCNTCHQGRTRPNPVPTPWYKTAEEVAAYRAAAPSLPPGAAPANVQPPQPSATPPAPAASLPTVDQVMVHYHQAVGAGAVKSIHMTGTNAAAIGNAVPFELYAVFPDKFLIVSGNPAVQAQTIVNGGRAWRVTPQAKTEMQPAQMAGLKAVLDGLMPLKYETPAGPRAVTGIEKVGDKACYVVESRIDSRVERLYYGVESGLLYKFRVEVGTGLGTRVEERTFEDYRDVHGVKLSFLLASHYMEDQTAFTVSDVQTNIDIDMARFEVKAPAQVELARFEPQAAPAPRGAVTLTAKALDALVGDYGVAPTSVVTVSRDGNRLFVTNPNGPGKFELIANTPTAFSVKGADTKITFVKNAKGQVAKLVVREGGADKELAKIK